MNKEDQRVLVNEILNNISKKEIELKSREISKILVQFLNELKIPNKLIGVYAPMSKEVKWFLAGGAEKFKYCLPQMESRTDMKFYDCSFDEVKSFSYKDDFKSDRSEVFPDVLLVPGLAFDKSGSRLGRGKGYFDRYLSNKDILKIGICFKEQLLDKVVTDENDINMNYIMTENTVFKGIK